MSGFNHRRSRGRRFARRTHAERERERRAVQAPPAAIEAHDPEHPTSCLQCFVARIERRRSGGTARP